jgi:hypothetical protein
MSLAGPPEQGLRLKDQEPPGSMGGWLVQSRHVDKGPEAQRDWPETKLSVRRGVVGKS